MRPKRELLAAQQDCTCAKRWNGHTYGCWARIVKRMLAHAAEARSWKAKALTKKPRKAK